MLNDLFSIAACHLERALVSDETEIDQPIFDKRQAAIALRKEIKLDLLDDSTYSRKVAFQRIEALAALARYSFIAANRQPRISTGRIYDQGRFKANSLALGK
jgi:hypothetical protein